MTIRRFGRLLPALLLLALACSGDDPVAPDPPEAELVAEATVGPEGGSLGDDDVTVTAAPGALPAAADLALYRLEDVDAPEAVTGRFRLEGLPPGGSVTIALAAPGAEPGGTYLDVADGEDAALLPATLADGVLTAELTLIDAAKSDQDVIADFLGVDGIVTFELPAADPFLRCRVPEHRRAAVESALTGVIGLWQQLRAGDFDLWGEDDDGDSVDVDELDVLVRDIGIESLRPAYFSARERSFCYEEDRRAGRIVIHTDALDAGSLADTRDHILHTAAFDLAVLKLPHETAGLRVSWLPAAFALWAESVHRDEPPVPSADQLLGILRGLYRGAHPDLPPAPVDFAWGMSRFFAYALDSTTYGVGWLEELMDAVDGGAGTPENIVIAFQRLGCETWWHGWVEDLVGGEILPLGDVPFAAAADEVWSINDAQDESHVFSAAYPDLSCRIFSVRLDHDGFEDGDRLRFSLDGADLSLQDLELQLWIRDDGRLTQLAAGTDITVAGLRELRMTGAHLLAVVSNSYYSTPWDGEGVADLSVTLESTSGDPEVFQTTRCTIGFSGIEEFQHYEGDDCWSADGNVTTTYVYALRDGAWSGQTYTVTFDDTYTEPSNYRRYGSLSVTMDPTGAEVLDFSFTVTDEMYGVSETATDVLTVDWIGGGLLHDPENVEPHHYALIGEAVGDHIAWSHIRDWSEHECQRTVTSATALSSAIIKLDFAP